MALESKGTEVDYFLLNAKYKKGCSTFHTSQSTGTHLSAIPDVQFITLTPKQDVSVTTRYAKTFCPLRVIR